MTTISYVLYAVCGLCMLLAMVNLVLTIVRVIKYELAGEDIDIDATPMLRTVRFTGMGVLFIIAEAFYESKESGMTTSGRIVVVTTIVITVAIVGLLEYRGCRDRQDVKEGGEGFLIRKLL